MVDFIGTALLWMFAIILTLCFPLSEFARGMASNPDAHSKSRGALILSIIGLALIAGLIFD